MKDLNPSAAKNVVPFGKYKGQPVEVLAQDKPYLDWLSAQDWFKERYSGIYTLIVNNFSEATETPEHNALQVLFLDDDFCAALIKCVANDWIIRSKNRIKDFKEKAANSLCNLRNPTDKLALNNIITSLPSEFTFRVKFTKEFETGGRDVTLVCVLKSIEVCPIFYGYYSESFNLEPYETEWRFGIEIKPSVGDDYPAVLRQMKASKSSILFLKNYTGTGATRAQFVKTFELSGAKVVFLEEVDACRSAMAMLPPA